jgi:SAM-dependent methyltransferase
MGYINVVALDYSPEMLQIAKKKSCYKELLCVDLHDSPKDIQQTTGLGPDDFDAAISVGTFTPHHVGIEAILNIIHFVRSGGILTLSLREDFVEDASNGFRAKLEELEASGKIKRLEVTEPELYTAKFSQSILFQCWTFMVA